MKRHLLLFLLPLLVLCAKADPVEIDGIYYNLIPKGKAAEVARNPNIHDHVVIPETITYEGVKYTVTSIGYEAFYHCNALTSITIPSSVTYIGYCAFEECTGLTSLTIPNGVTTIGQCAVRLCSGLSSIEIPNSVTSIDYGAFWGCTGLTSITIPNSVTSIGGLAFAYCKGLTSVRGLYWSDLNNHSK